MKYNAEQLELPTQPAQQEFIVCQICGDTWKVDNAKVFERAWKSHGGPLCDFCCALNSLRNQALAQKLTLKDVVFRFLTGLARNTRQPFRSFWE